ncbi:polysaccharide deacetylase family protein [Aureibaculum marinum]|uniref:Polysaccharide deacetylase family protein n=1 Tax=Aureibaculum marinum TaxID=2487930 RepID=A0A3N4NRZ8_9FLAO|nr:polysaccharide deacetylase family protein [Aureibaculum marinum]RPD95856.1 polysaccharide deacetylase family protein [Aureibaculum marinum]
MNSYFTRIPYWIKAIFPNQIWSLPNTNKEIYLTFDDGPTPEITEWILKTLEQYNAKATFFCVGNNIKKHPTLFNNIIKNNHNVGNHTFNHEKGWKTNNNNYLNSILKTEELIRTLFCQTLPKKNEQQLTKLFRPPYGKIKRSQTKSLIKKNYKIVMWSVLSWDFDKSINSETCLNNVIKNTQSGDIVVFHDNEKAFDKLKVVLPKTLEHFSKKGYVFKKIT